MNEKISCFLPCRAGSERVPNKNIKAFGIYENGLIEIKLKQLLSCSVIDEVVLSTNDQNILSFAKSIKHKKLKIHKRSEELCSNKATTDSLIKHASDLISVGHILWTHVTSPFVDENIYRKIIENYFSTIQQGYDSLMTVSPIHGFLWKGGFPINYDRSIEKWPRTQTIEPVFEVNSAAFLCHRNIYVENEDRIGNRPFLYELDKIKGFDIDWPKDFNIAESIMNTKQN